MHSYNFATLMGYYSFGLIRVIKTLKTPVVTENFNLANGWTNEISLHVAFQKMKVKKKVRISITWVDQFALRSDSVHMSLLYICGTCHA